MRIKQNINIWLRLGYGIILGILFNFLIDLIFRLIYTQYSLFQPLSKYIAAILITYIVFESLFWINNKLGSRIAWEKYPIFKFIGQVIIDTVVAVVIVNGLRTVIALFFGFNDYIRLQDEIILLSFIFVLAIASTTLELIIFLFNKWRYSIVELERFKKENAEFKFESLRSQLNPHFLFNSLNTLSSLVFEDQKKAEIFIRELSDVYRYILDNRDNELVSLNQEIDFANAYIKLLKVRFDRNIVVDVIKNNNHDIKKIAPLSIQLLIENAIKHNVISKKFPLSIIIQINANQVIVKNNIKLKQVKEHSSELGLVNIKSRYNFLTDQPVEVYNTGADFIVKIPLI